MQIYLYSKNSLSAEESGRLFKMTYYQEHFPQNSNGYISKSRTIQMTKLGFFDSGISCSYFRVQRKGLCVRRNPTGGRCPPVPPAPPLAIVPSFRCFRSPLKFQTALKQLTFMLYYLFSTKKYILRPLLFTKACKRA